MQYLCLIYTSEAEMAKMSKEENEANMGAYFSFTEEVREAGVLVGGEALEPIATATSVRVVDGKTVTTDGPFAETREQLGGYYLLDCKDLDEAIAYAAKIPASSHGTVEVRPIMSFD